MYDVDIKKMMDEYVDWLKENYTTEKIDDFYVVHTPFNFSNFDLIDFIVYEKDGKLILSDDGEVLNNLYIAGLDIKKSKTRRKTLEDFLHMYGLTLNNDEEIIKETTPEKFSYDKHSFIQGLLATDDMFLTVNTRTKNYFIEDVKNFFIKEEIFASADINIKGRSHMVHHFDFLINKNKRHEERLIKIVNSLNDLRGLKAILYSFKDIEDKNRKTENIIIYNDTKK